MRLNVLACLPETSAARLSGALARSHDVFFVLSGADVRASRRIRGAGASIFDVAVIDPSTPGRDGRSEALAIVRHCPHVPVVLYVPLTEAAVRTIVALPRRVSSVVLHGFDDQPERLRQIVESAAVRATAMRLVERLQPSLERLPAPLAEAVRSALAAPGACPNVAALAESAGFERRTLDRWFARAGFTSAGSVLAAARALEAYDTMRLNGLSAAAAARRLRYRSAKTFDRRTTSATGISPAALRGMSDREVMELILERIVREPAASRRRRVG